MPLTKYFHTQSAALARLLKRVRRRPSVGDVHDLRVATRRARAALWVLRKSSPEPRVKSLNRRLRKMGKALGAVRELDVAIKDAKAYGLDPAPLKARRSAERKRLRRALMGEKTKELLRGMASVAETMKRHPAQKSPKPLAELRRKLAPWGAAAPPKEARLHELRIAVKKTRYALEALGKPVKPLKALQDALGKTHDLAVLQGHLGPSAAAQRDLRRYAAKSMRLARPALRSTLRQAF